MTENDLALRDASSRFIWPPVIFTTACILAWVLSRYANFAILPESTGVALRFTGWIIVAIGVAIAAWAELLFLFARTATLPIHATSTIVTTGIYTWSRNPMYLGMSLFTGGLAFVFNSLWFLLALLGAMAAVTKLAIEPEEKYLERKFGQTYLDYKTTVRRWI